MYKYHVSYYDPFPVKREYATNDWSDVETILVKYGSVSVHIHNRIRNKSMCPYCVKD